MDFYHGTNEVIGRVDLSKGRYQTDFGKGFYLTDQLKAAKKWAVRRSRFNGGTPTVLSYSVDKEIFNSIKLKKLRFNHPDADWLHFIRDNREQDEPRQLRHDYDVVTGPIANDDIAIVIADYIDGVIDEDEAIRRAKALPATFQLSLHTTAAVSYVDEDNVKYRQFKNGTWTNWTARKMLE